MDDAPELQAATSARVNSAAAEARAHGALPSPTIGADSTIVPDAETEFELSVSQAIPLTGRASAHRNYGERRGEIAKAQLSRELHERRADLADAFYAALASQQRIAVLDEKLEAVARASKALERRVAAGDAAPFEFARMEGEVRRVRASRAAAAAELDSELARLGQLAFTSAPTTVDGELAPANCERGNVAPAEAPELEAMREASLAAASVARAERGPELGFGAGWITVGASNSWNHGIVAGLELALPLWSRTADAVEAAEAEAAAADAELALVNRRADLESAALAKKCEALQQTAADAAASVEKTRELLQSVESGYLAGELGLLELLDAQHAVSDDRLATIELQHAARRAHNDIKRKTGGWK